MENVYKVFGREMMPEDYLPDDYTGTSPGTCTNILGIGPLYHIYTVVTFIIRDVIEVK